MKKSVLISLLILFLAVCVVLFSKNNVKKDIVVKTENITDEKNTSINVESTAYNDLIIIPQKCINCGKCYRFDNKHFGFDSMSNKAIVISSKNLNDTNLKQIINICPTNAIALK